MAMMFFKFVSNMHVPYGKADTIAKFIKGKISELGKYIVHIVS